MIAADLDARSRGCTLRLPESRDKGRRYTVVDAVRKGSHVLVTARDSHGRIVPLPLAPDTEVELTP